MVVFSQKKKSKILNNLITAMFAVFCVALLCVSAFASSTVIVPQTTVTFNDDGVAFLSQDALFSVGSTYLVNWNGTEYTFTAQDLSSVMPGVVAFGNLSVFGLSGNGEPFAFASLPGEGSIVYSFDGSTSATISVYQPVDQNAVLFDNLNVLVSSSVGWVGQFVIAVTAQPLLLCFCIVIFVGVGIGLFSRIKR